MINFTKRGQYFAVAAAVFLAAPVMSFAQVSQGMGASASQMGQTAIGDSAVATTTDGMTGSTAVGWNARATVDDATAIGEGTSASGSQSTAVGANASASNQEATAIGTGSLASGNISVGVGAFAKATAVNTAAVGPYSTASGANSTTLGAYSSSTGNNSVAIGYQSNDGGQANVVSFGDGTATRRLVNILPGIGSNDAVVMSQIDSVVSTLGGGAAFNGTTGGWTAPVFVVPTTTGSASYSTVSAALAGIGTRVTTLENTVSGLGTSSSTSPAPTSPASTSTASVTTTQVQQIANTAMNQATSYTDQQVSTLSNQLGAVNSRIDGLSDEISTVDRQAREGIAATAALTRTAVAPRVPGHVVVMTGGAVYRGTFAGALGVSRWSDDGNNNVNLGVATSGGSSSVVSVGYAHIF